MSEYNSNNDTFLSRVFGLHSVYNQLQNNYQYYDPDIDSTYNQSASSSPKLRTRDNNNDDNGRDRSSNSNGSNNNNNLLDSESDSDLSSSPSPSPSRSTQVQPQFQHSSSQVNWIPAQPQYGQDGDEDEYDEAGEGKDLLTSLSGPTKDRRLKFSIPKVNNAKEYIFNKLYKDGNQSALPLYNEPVQQQFRKQIKDDQPSIQTIYQKKNRPKNIVIPPKERALYLWANITNMDEFLTDVYYYYRGKGLLNIVLTRLVDLLILVFILSFTVFLKWGINYDFFLNQWSRNSNRPITLSDLIIPNFLMTRVPLSIKVLLFGFTCYIILRLIQLYFNYNYKLREIRNFYKYLIGISNDDELMTISWITIVERLMLLKDYNSLTSTNSNLPPHYLNDLKSKVRLNAHDIANRIMRKENYMIALINKDVLDLSIPLPLPSLFKTFFTNKSVLTRTLEWNLKLCINNFIFNQHGQINSNILKEVNRNQLSKELSSRFKMAAIINLILCPFIVIYFVLLYFFRYFTEYKSNPSSILGLRQYTPWAEWKLREFNELPHFFIKRLHLSIGPANTYINQFPRGFIIINLMNLVNFVSGAIMAVLVIMGLWFEDEEHSFWSFEITENKSTLFYISLFGTLWAISSTSLNVSTSSNTSENLNSNSSSFFYDPEASLRYVSQFTHYLPSSWNGKLHTLEVKNEFCELYSLKIIIIINEILSLILTPFVLWFKISSSSSSIIDFFREYSIHVDGLGYVCYFAMFNFEEKDKNMMYDLNKKKKKKSKKYNKKDSANEVELDNIKSKRKDKAKISDSESSSEKESDESDDDLNHGYYQDEKMIKSYMYFLESYGGANANNRQPHQQKNITGLTDPAQLRKSPMSNTVNQSQFLRKKPNQGISQSNIDPSPSLLYQGATNNTNLNQSLTESIYNINYKFDEPEDELIKQGKKSGVLGMLNQFYKQDIGR